MTNNEVVINFFLVSFYNVIHVYIFSRHVTEIEHQELVSERA